MVGWLVFFVRDHQNGNGIFLLSRNSHTNPKGVFPKTRKAQLMFHSRVQSHFSGALSLGPHMIDLR